MNNTDYVSIYITKICTYIGIAIIALAACYGAYSYFTSGRVNDADSTRIDEVKSDLSGIIEGNDNLRKTVEQHTNTINSLRGESIRSISRCKQLIEEGQRIINTSTKQL